MSRSSFNHHLHIFALQSSRLVSRQLKSFKLRKSFVHQSRFWNKLAFCQTISDRAITVGKLNKKLSLQSVNNVECDIL